MYLLFDIGGTHTRLGLSFDGITIKKTRIIDTFQSFDEGVEGIHREVYTLCLGRTLKAIDVAYYLAFGIHNSILHWSPEIVILGGAMMKSISLDNITNYLQKILTIFPQLPILKKAALKDIGGLYGALVFLKQIHEQ